MKVWRESPHSRDRPIELGITPVSGIISGKVNPDIGLQAFPGNLPPVRCQPFRDGEEERRAIGQRKRFQDRAGSERCVSDEACAVRVLERGRHDSLGLSRRVVAGSDFAA